jgi:hypothetical protein
VKQEVNASGGCPDKLLKTRRVFTKTASCGKQEAV